jgi:hypothetical protein
VAAAAAADPQAPAAAVVPTAPATASASSAAASADLSSPPLEMPPVFLAGGADPPEAGAPERGTGTRGRPGKRNRSQGGASSPPRRAPTEPQIVNEPRY